MVVVVASLRTVRRVPLLVSNAGGEPSLGFSKAGHERGGDDLSRGWKLRSQRDRELNARKIDRKM